MAREPSFEWDDAKDRANRAKHGVTFRLAQTAFLDRAVLLPKIWSIAAPSGVTSASAS
jgi:uncharacterized DUF497 family protein